MFTQADYDELQKIMAESPKKQELLTKLLESHKMEISSISHEIRNPLTLVYSTLQLIETRHPEVLTYHHWTSMRSDIEYMNELLSALSAYNNSGRLSREHIDTGSFLKSLALSFAASLTDTDIEFTSRIEPGLPGLYADTVKLRQLLLNLLRNAQEAAGTDTSHQTASHSGIRPQVRLHAYTADARILVTVSDNGCGICPENIETIFEPFITYKRNGSGLGLPIARRIAAAHGGSLTVSSQPGGPTVFTLTLPVQ